MALFDILLNGASTPKGNPEMQMAMAGGIKPTATDLGWPEDMGDEDKALVIWLMMNHNKIKGGPNPFLDPYTGVPAMLKYKHFGKY